MCSWRTAPINLITLWCRCYARCRSEPVDLVLLLSHTNMNRSLAPAQVDVDSARHDAMFQCAAGGQP
jgi:hypothetical protein